MLKMPLQQKCKSLSRVWVLWMAIYVQQNYHIFLGAIKIVKKMEKERQK